LQRNRLKPDAHGLCVFSDLRLIWWRQSVYFSAWPGLRSTRNSFKLLRNERGRGL